MCWSPKSRNRHLFKIILAHLEIAGQMQKLMQEAKGRVEGKTEHPRDLRAKTGTDKYHVSVAECDAGTEAVGDCGVS